MTTICPPQGFTIIAKPYLYVSEVTSATHTTIQSDQFIPVSYTATGAVTITLSLLSRIEGNAITVKDIGGNATNCNITIATEGSEKIDGYDTYTINGNYDSVTMICDGSNWWLV